MISVGQPQLVCMGAHELAHLLDQHEVKLVDVREREEFASCRILGAVCDPLGSFDPGQYAKDEQSRVVFYCGTGTRSEMAARRLLAEGVPHVRHLGGGLAAWRAAGLAVGGDD